MISGLIDHLWQSTLLAAAAWLLTLALRKNRAQVRYWIWFTSSVKFLVPFALLSSLGASIAQFVPRSAEVSSDGIEWVAVWEQVSQPLNVPAAAARTAVDSAEHDYAALAALSLWALGFVVIGGCWLVRWGRVRTLRKSAAPLSIPNVAIPVMSSPGLIEPGVFGIFRPVLLLPEGITERLNAAQLHAILAHEICHVRRRDNLTATIHVAAQAIFWFHPLVWWVGARLVEERERACDEEVLRLGSAPQVYAESILNVCKLYVESPLVCMSGVSGSKLQKRIEAIMMGRVTHRLNPIKKAVLAAAGLSVLVLPVAIGLANSSTARAQDARNSAPAPAPNSEVTGPQQSLTFEVASIKPGDPQPQSAMLRFLPSGRMVARNFPLALVIQEVYKVGAFQIIGLEKWTSDWTTTRFDIEAKASEVASRDQLKLMAQTLLADRFQMTFHRETRDVSVYALIPAKDGIKLQLAKDNGTPRGTGGINGSWPMGRLFGSNVSMEHFVQILSEQQLDRPVVDRTNFTEAFDFNLQYVPFDQPGVVGPSIFTAVQEQLGLKLDPVKASTEVMVIDHIEKPSKN